MTRPAARPELTVVLDVHARGSDPLAALRAAATATTDLDVNVVLVGDPHWIEASLRTLPHDAERVRVRDASVTFVADAPQKQRDEIAARSVQVALTVLASSPEAVLISSARASTVAAAARATLTPLAAPAHPALAAVYPTLRHRGEARDPLALILDVGAAIECDAEQLCAFAVMGATYARLVSLNPRPRVGLLCPAGALELAPQRVVDAHQHLQALAIAELEYIGLLRADQLTRGDADVVVTDGFTGDVFVRALEGVSATAERLLQMAQERFRWRLGVSILAEGVSRLRELGDWENYGGAPLLGFDRGVILTQRESGRRAFVNAVRLAAKIDRLEVIRHIGLAVSQLQSDAR